MFLLFRLSFFMLFLSASVFAAPSQMTMQEIDKLIASDGQTGDDYAVSVAISGNTVVIGAMNSDNGTTSILGSAYIYELNTETELYEESAKLTASDADHLDIFGWSVTISGNTVVIGAYGDDDGGSYSGSAYLFEKPVTGWVSTNETAKLTASDAVGGEQFGWSVAISSDTIVVGANNALPGGKAYLFEKPDTGIWVSTYEDAKLTASDTMPGDNFGYNLAIDGNTVIIGAYTDDLDESEGPFSAGSAYIFEKPVTGWGANTTETAKLTAMDASDNDNFGKNVAISDDTVLIGAPGDDTDDLLNFPGSAYLFEKPAEGWDSPITYEDARLTASNASNFSSFGSEVAISGNTVLIGSNKLDESGNDKIVYHFEKPVTGWTKNHTEDAMITSSASTANSSFGSSIDISGDTAIIGAQYADCNDGNIKCGAAYLFKNKSSTTANAPLIMYLLD